MKKGIVSAFLLLILVFTGCETSPPINVQDDVFGGVAVTGSPVGAAIFLDGNNTGKVIPDTLQVKAGVHQIGAQMDGFLSETKNITVPGNSITNVVFDLAPVTEQKVVVLEDFANVSCVPCVTSNLVINALQKGTYKNSPVLFIKYHVNYPSPQDPFYQANRSQLTARAQLYNVLSTPTTFIDGRFKPLSADSNQIKQYIEQQLRQPARFRMTATDSIASGEIHAKIGIEVLSIPEAGQNDIVLHVFVVQEEVSFTTPPGSNGETVFHDVVRGFFTGAAGFVPAFNGDNGQKLNYSFSLSTGTGWDLSKIKVVAFLQNKNSKEIYQSAFSIK
ncbi:MAG: PEGA domain-containing protein [Ignavibacteriales bacterium]|jgi:PEGA domain.|nr:MAG: PEGA domain-containing protein [Ignavibacteriaceae bacterium]MBW7872772.1 PEGA domain-containing protein [Ignavibacteria bacterium]MCZ2143492.1 PEGA domain-containing protein [Ignavibacteriales bacterium]OQY72515.1 MAG: hypothetical protein B6D45_09080 [Ignavibacteriales bacterium UTCHB3]MBV6444369.1 hypothetical protein [Ignavibacteriaceae bacterium]